MVCDVELELLDDELDEEELEELLVVWEVLLEDEEDVVSDILLEELELVVWDVELLEEEDVDIEVVVPWWHPLYVSAESA